MSNRIPMQTKSYTDANDHLFAAMNDNISQPWFSGTAGNEGLISDIFPWETFINFDAGEQLNNSISDGMLSGTSAHSGFDEKDWLLSLNFKLIFKDCLSSMDSDIGNDGLLDLDKYAFTLPSASMYSMGC
jgi:hypothetical protein